MSKRPGKNIEKLSVSGDVDLAQIQELDGLKHREVLFVLEYAKSFSVTRATERAGYKGTHGWTVKRRPRVKRALDRIFAGRLMSTSEALALLNDQARSSMEDVLSSRPRLKKDGSPEFDEDGQPVVEAFVDPLKAIRAGKGHLIREVIETKEGLKVKMVNNQEALKLILKARGALEVQPGRREIEGYRFLFDDDDAEDIPYEIL